MPAMTLVLLHGVGLDHSVWDPMIARVPAGVRVIRPDLPCHGTNRQVAGDVTLAGLAEAVATRIPQGSHVVGFSLGALVAQHLAVFRPELVASLTSVSSVCDRTPDERAAVLARLMTAESDFAGSITASLRRWYDGTAVSAEQVAHTRDVLSANDPGSFVRCYRVFATADVEIAPLLPAITAPALAITGQHDPGSTPEMTQRLAAAIPDCEAVVIPGARHMLPVERPDDLFDHLFTFIGGPAHA
ncbi:alpha/beta fold hydrolase [Nocardia rhamnosiphila]